MVDDIVARLQEMLDGPVPWSIERQDVRDAIAEIERLRAAGDALVAAIRKHDLREKHIKAWEEARRE